VQIFDFDVEAARAEYRRQGWIHIPQGMHPDFLFELRESVREYLDTSKLDAFAIKGKKEQALYTFPDSVDFPGELFDVVSTVCDLNRPTMTLSERHIQAYESNAAPEPQAHKDRFPSQVSVGFSVEIPAESRLVLYPYDRRELNPFNAAAALIRTLQPDQLPDVVLRDAREVELADRPGDVVMFPGSTTWHLRRRSAGAVNLYVKMNDFDCDPLGEDPSTAARREQSLALLANGEQASLNGHTVKLSRRFDSIDRRMMRGGWGEVLEASLYGEPAFGINEVQLALLRAAIEARPAHELVAEVAGSGHTEQDAEQGMRLLVEHGALDLLG
jgi:hypothetical protein